MKMLWCWRCKADVPRVRITQTLELVRTVRRALAISKTQAKVFPASRSAAFATAAANRTQRHAIKRYCLGQFPLLSQ